MYSVIGKKNGTNVLGTVVTLHVNPFTVISAYRRKKYQPLQKKIDRSSKKYETRTVTLRKDCSINEQFMNSVLPG